jgi:hypothetical protein
MDPKTKVATIKLPPPELFSSRLDDLLHLLQFRPGAAVFHDAGKGKEDYAISCIRILADAGVACVVVDCMSARIGDVLGIFESGVLSDTFWFKKMVSPAVSRGV